MLLPFLPLLAPDAVADAFSRCNAFLNRANVLSVQIKAKSNRLKGAGTGSFAFKRPGTIKYAMNWGGERYVFWGTPQGGLEWEASSQSYCEVPPEKGFYAPAARVSGIPEACFPDLLLRKDMQGAFPKGAKYTVTPHERFAGGTADHLHATMAGEGSFSEDLYVASDGAPAGFKIDIEAPGMSLHTFMVFSHFVVNKPLPPATFVAMIPRGFLPESFNMERPVIQSGAPMPLAGWMDLRSRKTADLAKDPPAWRLFAVMAPNCVPSRKALMALRRLPASMPVVILSTDPSPAQSWSGTDVPICYDPTETALAKLSAPGTPLFLLTDGQGVVQRVWYGFDPAQSEAFLKEIQAVASVGGSAGK